MELYDLDERQKKIRWRAGFHTAFLLMGLVLADGILSQYRPWAEPAMGAVILLTAATAFFCNGDHLPRRLSGGKPPDPPVDAFLSGGWWSQPPGLDGKLAERRLAAGGERPADHRSAAAGIGRAVSVCLSSVVGQEPPRPAVGSGWGYGSMILSSGGQILEVIHKKSAESL